MSKHYQPTKLLTNPQLNMQQTIHHGECCPLPVQLDIESSQLAHVLEELQLDYILRELITL